MVVCTGAAAGDEPEQLIDQRGTLRCTVQQRSVPWPDKAVRDEFIEKPLERIIEAGNIEQPDGFVMNAQLQPRQCLEGFFERPETAGQCDESVAEFSHFPACEHASNL